MKVSCAVGALALLFPLTAGSILLFAVQKRAGANSAPAYWEGAQSSGALLAGDECPIAVEKEVLTVNVPEFPSLSGEEGTFAEYGASVTARYTFRNPTGEEVKATLLFPFGTVPDYAPYGFDFYGDTARYAVRENGNAVPVKSRYSYCTAAPFSVDDGIASIAGSAADAFFREDTPVTTHTFRVHVPEEAGDRYLTLAFALKADPARTRIASSGAANACVEKGLAVITYSFPRPEADFEFSLYVFGEDATVKKKGVYAGYADREPVAGTSVEEISSTQSTFGTFAKERYARFSAAYAASPAAVSETDWLSGFSDALGSNVACAGLFCSCSPDDIDPSDFMRWYEYELTFPANGNVVNEVTAPLYPTVHGSGKGRQYDYTYLLSPARKWASFGSLRIELITPYYLSGSSLDFEKTDGGYVLDWNDGLPLGELKFTLSETESTPVDGFLPYRGGLSALQIAVVVLLGVVVVATIVTVVLLVTLRKKPASDARGEAREGEVDLPPDEKPHKKP